MFSYITEKIDQGSNINARLHFINNKYLTLIEIEIINI
jgi:hypothetical protein